MAKASAENDESVDLEKAIKSELYSIIPDPEFVLMKFEFLMNFVVENGFILLPVHFLGFYLNSRKTVSPNETAFQRTYKLVEKQALKKKIIADQNGESFNIFDTIVADLAEVKPRAKLHNTDKNFDFVVENGFYFSANELKKIYERFFKNEEQKFQSVYELAKKQALKKQSIAAKNGESFNLADSIKADLAQVMPIVDFYKMDKQFLMDFVFEKGFVFSSSDLLEYFKRNLRLARKNLQNAFTNTYELAEKKALKKQSIAAQIGQIFNVADSIKADLAQVIPIVDFYKMDKQFLMDFVVERGFFLSATDLLMLFKNLHYGSNHKKFVAVYELAEKQALKKQSIAAKNGESFNLADSIKADLTEVMPMVHFFNMDKHFLMEFVIEKGFILSSSDLHAFFKRNFKIYKNLQNAFKKTFKLAEKQAFKKQSIAAEIGQSFDVSNSIEADLAEVMPMIDFYKMDKQFLMDFVVEKGFILSPNGFCLIFQSGTSKNEKRKFKYIYKLAEKQALKKQIIADENGESFEVSDSIKADLAKVIPHVEFCKMNKQFLMDFVLENGFFLSPTELYQIFNFVTFLNKRQKFKYVFELAEKQAFKKQMIASKNGVSFNVSDSMKADLAEVLLRNKDIEFFNFLFDNPHYGINLLGICVFTFSLYSHFKKL